MRILSPAGNFECLKMAVYNGADEVYLGINNFNARNNIDGFTMDNIKEAIDFAHIYNVKVNVAINILFNDNEIQDACDTIVDCYNMGVDCFIIQDLGLATIIHKNYPEIEIHASTQMGIHNLEGVKYLEQFGFKRIVLSRETSLDEIKRIRQNSNVELEFFIQGALCVSFSGNCYLSSYLCNASGNRGKCKQLCRLPYQFMKDEIIVNKGFLLSAKDFDMRNHLKDLEDAGIDVLKIEGRARRPSYVAMTTREYYNILHGKGRNNDNIELSFNRNYTEGYFNGNGDIISRYNNHIGIQIGKILKVNTGKRFNEIIFSSNRKLSLKSTFKLFAAEKEVATITAYDLKEIEKNKYLMTTTQSVKEGLSINLILDYDLEEECLNFAKKIDINVKIDALRDNPIKAETIINNEFLSFEGCVCEVAQNSPLTKDELISNFKKSDIFNVNLTCDLDNVFLQKKKLNDFRRAFFEKVILSLTNNKREKLKKIKIDISQNIIKFENFQFVGSIDEKFTNKNIVYSPELYILDDIKNFILKCKSEGKNPFLDTPNFATQKDYEMLKNIIDTTRISIIANNYYALTLKTHIIIGAGLNVYNHLTAQYFNSPVITAESDISSKNKFYYMTLRHCPFKTNLKCNCNNCKYEKGYYYKMENGMKLFIERKKLSSCTFYLK